MNELVFFESIGIKIDAFTTSDAYAMRFVSIKKLLRASEFWAHIRPKLQTTRRAAERALDTY